MSGTLLDILESDVSLKREESIFYLKFVFYGVTYFMKVFNIISYSSINLIVKLIIKKIS
jgi:hypothetical protein